MKYKYPITDVQICHIKQIEVEYSDYFDKKGYVYVQEWRNGEGFTLCLNSDSITEVTWSQWDCLKKAINTLHKTEKII